MKRKQKKEKEKRGEVRNRREAEVHNGVSMRIGWSVQAGERSRGRKGA